MARGRIFVIDDEEDNIEYLSAIIEDAGFQAETASDGARALVRLRDDPPDLVFLDVQMPGMNGFEVLKAIREIEALAKVPVVLLSAIGAVTGEEFDPEKIRTRYGVEPDAFVPKPVEPRRIVAQIERFLRSAASD